ncbi:MAG: XdhC family protein [Acidithiobacillus sp.]
MNVPARFSPPLRVLREALVLRVQGSAPTAVGSSLSIRENGSFQGTVGGGHMEFEVLQHLREPWTERTQLPLNFVLGAADDQCCGGRVEIALVHVPLFLSELYQPDTGRVYAINEQGLLHLVAGVTRLGCRLGDHAALSLLDGAQSPGWSLDEKYFLVPAVEKQPLWIFGAGHVGRTLAAMGSGLDFRLTVFDARPEWADPQAFPEEVILNRDWSFDTLPELPYSCRVLIMTYSHTLDYRLLTHFVHRPLAYLGVIASRSKAARFRHALTREGISIPAWLHMPMGLPGMGKTPAEIAVSILAELLQLRHGKKECEHDFVPTLDGNVG